MSSPATFAPVSWNGWVIEPTIRAAFKKFTRDDIERRFSENGLPPGSVNDLSEVFQNPQVIHNDMVLDVEHPVYGHVKLTGFLVKLSETPATLRRPTPTTGEQNDQVLEEFGYSANEIRGFQDAGVVSSENLVRANGVSVH
jgi:crotonobetainyl-CoA:carnitine CoA-transferase CaiB-like acyl-CoA transferase